MNMPVERVREILKISQEPVSLETPIGEEEDSHLGDFIQDDNVPVPAEAAAFTLLKEQLVEVLSTLTEREQKVLRLRFGLDDGRARTLEEVGKEFNVTRERIRQIEAKALRKLRHPSRSRKLRTFWSKPCSFPQGWSGWPPKSRMGAGLQMWGRIMDIFRSLWYSGEDLFSGGHGCESGTSETSRRTYLRAETFRIHRDQAVGRTDCAAGRGGGYSADCRYGRSVDGKDPGGWRTLSPGCEGADPAAAVRDSSGEKMAL